MSNLKLVPQAYFEDVVKAMNGLGFTALSQVAIDTNDFEHCVQAKYARDTRLFFYKHGYNCFIVLSFNETEFQDGRTQSWWTIRTDVEYSKQVQFFYPSLDGDDDENEVCAAMMSPECKGFQHTRSKFHCFEFTWNFEQEDIYVQKEPLSPQELAVSVSSLQQNMGDNFAVTPFSELQVSSWQPDYCFRGCGEVFWKRFRESCKMLHNNHRHFWTLVIRPWGSGGLKR